jgi:PTS system nitrogen regulatory IIA component
MRPIPFPRWRPFLPPGPPSLVGLAHGEDAAGPADIRLAPCDVLLDVVVSGRSELLAEIAQHMASVHGLDGAEVEAALAHRERIASTALGQGAALPHARIAGLQGMRAMYLRLKLPIPYEAPDGQPVADVFVLLVPRRATQLHLDALARVTQWLADRALRARLHRCRRRAEVIEQLEDSGRP